MSLQDWVSEYSGTTQDALKQLLRANTDQGTNGYTEVMDLWRAFLTQRGFGGDVADAQRRYLLAYLGLTDTGQTQADLWGRVTGPYTVQFGPDLYAGFDFNTFSKSGVTTVNSANSFTTTGSGGVSSNLGLIPGRLYLFQATFTGTAPAPRIDAYDTPTNSVTGASVISTRTSDGSFVQPYAPQSAGIFLRLSAAGGPVTFTQLRIRTML